MRTILGIESTCDETAAAVVRDGWEVRSNVIASQIELHQKFRGVVPEIASRAHLEKILPVITEAMDVAGVSFAELDAIAVAHRPGLIGSLLIGVTAAKTLAWSLGKSLIGVDHVHAHLFSVVLETDASPVVPAIGLVCSGGHTALYHMRDWENISLVGSTIDDAVGEAYDKVAAILGLPFPGGPIIDQLAAEGNPKAIAFPRSYLDKESLDFSFSGLKTSVLYHVRGFKGREREASTLSPGELRDVCASFQAACVEVLVKKIERALAKFRARSVIVGGGVSANRGLRAALEKIGVPVLVPKLAYCTDNAAMTAGLANVHFEFGRFSELNLDAITFSQFLDAGETTNLEARR